MIRTDQQGEFCDGSNSISMSRTFLEEAMADGAQIETGASVKRLRRNGNWNLHVSGGGGTREREVIAQTVFLAAGAIQTPRLLRRSGLTRIAGRQLYVQPVAEIVAEFSEPVNSRDMGMPPTQVHTFAPDMVLGIGISSPARLAVALASYPDAQQQLAERWRHMVVYTVLLGRSCPARLLFLGLGSTLVYHNLSGANWRTLGVGLKRLSQLLIRAGARQLYPVGDRALAIGPDDRCDAFTNLPSTFKPRLTSVHVTSSCPMGERGVASVCSSYGQVHGMPGLYIADASVLCTSPATNPQAIIMAIAHRNACHFAGRVVQLDGRDTGQNRLSLETFR
jgi:choline dehydrogenase-like flavoprotein